MINRSAINQSKIENNINDVVENTIKSVKNVNNFVTYKIIWIHC